MMKLKINNLKDNDKILWKRMSCTCKKGIVMEEYPVKLCLHCKYQQCEDSMPRDSFKVKQPVIENGKIKNHIEKIVKEITIIRGSHDDIVGWTY